MPMSWSDIPAAEKDNILTAYDSGALDWAALYLRYPDLPKQATVQRYIRCYRQFTQEAQVRGSQAAASSDFVLPDYPLSPTPLHEDWIEIDCDNAIVIADVELPDYDAQLMKLATAMAVQYDIRTLIIGGDYQAFDQQTLTQFRTAYREHSLSIREDFELAGTVLDKAREWFTDQYAVMGNHDERFGKALYGILGSYDVLNRDIQVQPYRYMYLNTLTRGRIMVVHPKNYSKDQLKVPRNLFDIEPERCSIMSTHTHHCAIGHPLPGAPYQICEIGCIRDPRRTAYKQRGKTFHPQWVQGFGMVLDGFIQIYPKETTNWQRELEPTLYRQSFE